MRKRILMIGMTLLVAVAAMGCNGNQQNNNLKIQEQLDLGYKYLNELDYENAIATYMAILEVDAKCVSAYQGIAEVYMAIGDYDSALKYVKEGYELTQDEFLAELLKQIESQIVERKAAEEEAAARKVLFEGHYVDGIWHNEYVEYDLAEEEVTYLQEIIDNANAENYENVFALLQSDKQENMLVRLEKTYTTGTGGAANIAYKEYKVRVTTNKGSHSDTRNVCLIPVTEDKGYFFEYSVSKNVEGQQYIHKNYAVCDCKEGMYNGKVSGKESLVSEEANVHNESSIEGAMVNGLRHGLWLFHESRLGDDYKITMMSEYTAGKPKAYSVDEKDGYNIYWTEVMRDENGNPDLSTKSGPNCTPEQFENTRYGIGINMSYTLGEREGGGYWCYSY